MSLIVGRFKVLLISFDIAGEVQRRYKWANKTAVPILAFKKKSNSLERHRWPSNNFL